MLCILCVVSIYRYLHMNQEMKRDAFFFVTSSGANGLLINPMSKSQNSIYIRDVSNTATDCMSMISTGYDLVWVTPPPPASLDLQG